MMVAEGGGSLWEGSSCELEGMGRNSFRQGVRMSGLRPLSEIFYVCRKPKEGHGG